MKKILVLVMAFAVTIIVTFAFADDEYTQGLMADMNAAQALQERATEAITYFESVLYDSEIDSIEINPNYGTDASGDFIALVHMNYDLYRPAADMGVLVHNSNIIADALSEDCPEVVELAVFWNLTAYDNTGKITYTIDNEGYHYEDAMLPKEMVN